MPMGLSIEVEENWRGTGRRNENVDMVGRPIEVSLAVRQKGGDGKCSALLFPITIDPADADSLEGVDIAVTEHELIAHFALSHEAHRPPAHWTRAAAPHTPRAPPRRPPAGHAPRP